MTRPTQYIALVLASAVVFTLLSLVALAAAPPNGGLVQIGCLGNAGSQGNNGQPSPGICSGANGLANAFYVAVSPDGKNVYAGDLERKELR
jgi:hypothetical protein